MCSSGMAIDDEVIVGSLFVLADAALDQRCVLHTRKAECHVLAGVSQSLRIDGALAGRGVEFPSARVVSDLESASLVAWDAVHEASAMIGPDRQVLVVESGIAGRRAEEKYILFSRLNSAADGGRKELAHPGAAGEYVAISAKLGSVGKRQGL